MVSSDRTAEETLAAFIDKFEPAHQALIRDLRVALRRRFPAANERAWRRAPARLCAAAAFATGCGNGLALGANAACDPSAPLALTAERRDSVRPVDEAMQPDAQWARLARTAPGGFAGAYFEQVPHDREGRPTRGQHLVIRLARPNERSTALRALLPGLAPTFGGTVMDSLDVLIVPAKWDFAQLDEWRRYLDDRVGMRGLTSAGTDAMTNQIRYGVADAASQKTIENRLRTLKVPCGLVAIEILIPRALSPSP